MFGDVFRDRTVWLSGHTGFKGSWLATWLLKLGARVHGFALAPPTDPNLFEQLELAARMEHELGDVRDAEAVARSLRAAAPDFVFHLAAQPLVRLSYQEPVATYATNVMGTVHVLEALRQQATPAPAIFITTDKCYENRESGRAYAEEDPLGGYDPYSSSKAAAEISLAAYRRSFFGDSSPVRVASARAGNVIGGGDWALDRLVPDSMRALQSGKVVPVRNKNAIRPWQHVLEPLSGYLRLAQALSEARTEEERRALASAFNFGPHPESDRTVEQVVQAILKHWPGKWEDKSDPTAPHEAARLHLAIDKASRLLEWSPVWDFETTIAQTVAWYRAADELQALTLEQIESYQQDARAAGLKWARA